MPEPRRRGPGALAPSLQTGSKRSFLQELEKETELRKAEDGPFASYYVISSPFKIHMHLLKHFPCPLCCTHNLNTPKMQSHSGPKTNSLTRASDRAQTKFCVA